MADTVQLTHTGAQLDAAISKVENDYADVSGVTAVASDVAQGKYFVTSAGVLTAGTSQGGGGGATLKPPTLVLANEVLTILDGDNGAFSENFVIYADGNVLATQAVSNTTYDLSNAGLSAGNHTIGVAVSGTGMTNSPTVTVAYNIYTITVSVTNGTYLGDTTIATSGAATITITPSEGYINPTEATVTGANYSISEGVIALSGASANVTISVECPVYQAGIICTVTNYGAENPSDVTFTKDADFTLAGLGIEEVVDSGDTFIKIPTMYRKVLEVTNNQMTSFAICNAKRDNDFLPYPCFLDEDGNLLPYVLIGKYWNTSSSSCVSTGTGNQDMTLETGRTYARARGAEYQLYDHCFDILWKELLVCLTENVNTNSGSGITYDAMGVYWSSVYGWIDGLIKAGTTWYKSDKPSEYASLSGTSDPVPSGYTAISYAAPSSSNWIQKLGYDSNNPFFNYPSAVGGSGSTYYCDYYYYNSGNRPVISDVGFAGASCGAFYCSASYEWSSTNGVRLCKRPLSA